MKTILALLIRVFIVLCVVVLITALIYFLNGGSTSRGLSDLLVYASFLTLAAGTLMGVTRVGYKGVNATEADLESDSSLAILVHEFFRSGPFGIAVTLAGVLCFLVAILVLALGLVFLRRQA